MRVGFWRAAEWCFVTHGRKARALLWIALVINACCCIANVGASGLSVAAMSIILMRPTLRRNADLPPGVRFAYYGAGFSPQLFIGQGRSWLTCVEAYVTWPTAAMRTWYHSFYIWAFRRLP